MKRKLICCKGNTKCDYIYIFIVKILIKNNFAKFNYYKMENIYKKICNNCSDKSKKYFFDSLCIEKSCL
jgi:hypothetical protein